MAMSGTLLFQRGQTSENELWDDTALIKAYDNAVKHMKAKIKVENGEEAGTSGGTGDVGHKKKKNKRKRNKSKKKKWSIGDHCRATYEEDGLVYDAEIISLDEENGTCVVRYKGYGNEEEQNIADLLTATSHSHKPRVVSDIETDIDSMDWCGNSPNIRQMGGGQRQRPVNKNVQNNPYGWTGGAMFPPFTGMPPPPQFPFPVVPPYQHFPGAYPAGLPIIPPPPPPPMFNEDATNESEAVSSMLMSWYMSGYHTGYYQGLRQARHPSSVPTTHTDSGR